MKPERFKVKRHTVILSKIYDGRQVDPAGDPNTFSQNRLLITLFIIASILLALSSCEAPIEDMSSRDFIIRKGERYPSPRLFEQFTSGRLVFTATFDESAIYNVDGAGIEKDKNILMGFTDCSSLHNANSARFEWRWFNGSLNIYAHSYADGKRVEEFIASAELNQENRYEIAVTEDQYIFYMNGEQKTAFGRLSTCNEGGNYILFPYFAEAEPAPHNIKLQIQMLD